jgi:hypothetical protein
MRAQNQLIVLVCSLSLCGFALPAAAGPGGKLRIEVIDRDTKQPLACRMHLADAAGRPLKAPRVPFWHDHFVFDGHVTLKLPKGAYNFVIERGLEYRTRSGQFTIEDLSDDTKTVDLPRFADLAAEGWYSGDVHAARPAKDLPLLMMADDLHVVELVSWPNRNRLLPGTRVTSEPLVRFDNNRCYHLSAGIDARGGGTLLFYNLATPLDLGGLTGEYPPQTEAIAAAKSQPGAWVDAQTAYGWDVPLWVAAGQLDSIQVINSNLRRTSAADDERGGKPRSELLYPAPSGNGRWSEDIYYHLLNCGLRIGPTAGSGSGEVANPLGYNRMYVFCGDDFSYERWWEGVRAGRVVLTNGPLIRPNVEGEAPGHVFRADAGQEIELEIGLTLSTRDPISYVEVIKDGRLAYSARLAEWSKSGGRIPPLRFTESGWLLIRAVCDVPDTYRYAMTAPYYVQIGDRFRVSKTSAQFFLDWATERMANLKLDNPHEREAVLKYHRQAVKYWQDMVSRANAE